MGGASSTPTPVIPGGITIAASAVTVGGNGSKPHHRLESGSPEADEERMNILMPQTSGVCNNTTSDAEFCQVEEV